jgi:hypothetical protein
MEDGCNVLPHEAKNPCIPSELALSPPAFPPATIHRRFIPAALLFWRKWTAASKKIAALPFAESVSYNETCFHLAFRVGSKRGLR